MTNFEKLFKKLEKKFDKALDISFEAGYEDGFKDGHTDGHSEGFIEGIQAYKDHVQARLKASEELSMNLGKGAEAARMREMAKFLAFEYDPEESERQARITDENGF